MAPFLIQRLIRGILVLLAVSLIVFVLMHLTGDPAALMVPEGATADEVAEVRERMGFDRPILVQYVIFLKRAVTGDFGYSYRIQRPAFDLVVERIPATLRLMAASVGVSLAVALPVGVIAATHRNSLFDRISMVMILFGQSMPTFWFGIMAILIFPVRLGWLPTSGYKGPSYLVLPAITLGLYTSAVIARVLRSSLIEVLSRDYIRTARAKGLAGRQVLLRHAVKNAAIPVITVVGLQIGYLMGGSIITETVFGYPGMGLLAIQAIRGQDIPVLQSFVIFVAAIIVAINFLVDIAYMYLDPRVRYR
ncbi:MAG: ABC transporter permease [Thermomicrobiales bacterium]|jgi:peptide/nickel transport system permease protein|nr:ABC transporter permease [Thermomicrobiales bacterium]